jgi:hypothetical protein
MLLEDAERAKAQTITYSLKQKVLQGVANFVRGPAQAYAMQTFGSIAAGFSALGFIGISMALNRLNANAQLDSVTNIYRDELALILDKDRNAIMAEDFKQAALSAPANSPIRNDFEIIRTIQNATQIKSLVKNLAISAAVIGFAAVGGGLVMNMMGFTVIGGLALAIDLVTENTLGRWQQKQTPTSASFVDRIQVDMTRGIVSPSRLMEYSAIKNPELQKIIHDKFNSDYSTLSFKQKQEAITMVGQKEFLEAIARDLNDGRIRPSELPFLLSGNDSPSTSYASYHSVTAPKAKPAAANVAPDVLHSPAMQVTASELKGSLTNMSRNVVLH